MKSLADNSVWVAVSFCLALVGKKTCSIWYLTAPAAFATVYGGGVEWGGEGWRTVGGVHLYSHEDVGLGQAGTPCLQVFISKSVGAISRNL